jgi:hypothetical protein
MLTCLAAFFKEMLGAGNRNGCVSPAHLFGQVVKQSPKFRGMQQQDSQVGVCAIAAVLRIRIRSDPDLFAGSGSGNFTTRSGSSSGSF